MALSHSPSIVTEGLIVYLDPMNPRSYPGSGTAWYNVLGGTLFANITGGPTFGNPIPYSTWASGYNPSAGFIFNGINQWMDLGIIPEINNATELTIDIWYGHYVSTGSAYDTMISNGGNSAGIAGWRLRWGPTSSTPLELILRDGSGETDFSFANAVNSINQFDIALSGTSYRWNNAIVRLWDSGSTVGCDAMINGNALRTTLSANRTGITSTNALMIARSPTGATGTGNSIYGDYQRSISVVKIYNRRLSEQEMRQNYDALKGRFRK